MDHDLTAYPLAVMRVLADDKTRARIADAAADQVRRTKGPVQNAIRQAFLNKISGFRDPLRAPAQLLARELGDFLFDAPRPTRDLIQFWKQTLQGFDRSLKDFIDSIDDEASAQSTVNGGPEAWTPENVLELADAYINKNPERHRLEAAIALLDVLWERHHEDEHEALSEQLEEQLDAETDLTAVDQRTRVGDVVANHGIGEESPKAESPPSAGRRDADAVILSLQTILGQPPEALQSGVLREVMSQLEGLPPHASEWDEFPQFIAALVGALRRAMDEREEATRALDARLAHLPDKFREALDFADSAAPALRVGVNVPVSGIGTISSLCNELESHLEALTEALGERPRTWRAADEWHDRTTQTAAVVRRLLDEIAASLQLEPTRDDLAKSVPTELTVSPQQTSPPTKAGEEALSGPSKASTAPIETLTVERKPDSTDPHQETAVADVDRSKLSATAALVAHLPSQGSSAAVGQELAAGAVEDAHPQAWCTSAWKLAGEGDFAGAHWLVRALSARGRDCDLTEGLVASALGVELLATADADLVLELAQLVLGTQPVSSAARLFAHGIAVRGVLIDPSVGFTRWLALPSAYRPVQDLIEVVRQFGVAVHPEALLDTSNAPNRDEALRQRAEEIREWLRRAEHRTTKLVRANHVWQQLVRRDLTDLVRPILDDQRGRVSLMKAEVERWKDRRFVIGRIHEVDAELGRGAKSPLTGDPRDQILHRVREICELGLRWCSLVEAHRLGPQDSSFDRSRVLRERVGRILPGVEEVLIDLADSDGEDGAAARVALHSVHAVRAILNLPPSSPERASFDNQALWRLAEGRGLRAALAARLLWLPEIRFAAKDDVVPEDVLPNIGRAMQKAVEAERTLGQAFSGWISARDFRFVDKMATVLKDEPGFAYPAERLADELENARAALASEILAIQTSIEQATVDGVIDDEMRAEYTAVTALDPSTVRNFAERVEALARIRNAIESARERRIQMQRSAFDRLDRELAGGPHARDWVEKRACVLDHLDRGDTRLTDEWLAVMRDAADGTTDLSAITPPVSAPSQTHLESLLRHLPALIQLKAIPKAGDWPESLKELEAGLAGREQNAERLWQAWLALKRRASTASIERAFETLFYELGFRISSDVDRVSVTASEEWLSARIKMTTANQPPAPHFGSYSGDVFEALCVWKKPGTDLLRARLAERTRQQQPLLVIYFASLSAFERRQVTRPVAGRPIILLDEALVLFLAVGGGGLPAFLACTLPYTGLNPYTTAGKVPPELFQGRERLLEQLLDSHGSCLLYGGRQLGKSALLHHVAHRLNQPSEQTYAAVEDIQTIGSPITEEPAVAVWDVIRSALRTMPLFANRSLANSPDQLERQIRDVLERNPKARVTVGLDEADNFLAADADREFTEVARLRSLMTKTDRRFRIILAGARTAQKYQAIPNQPLAHLGPALRIGPLETEGALRLIREPLSAFGVRFVDPTLALRILSFTNYHPAIIQFVCSEILNTLTASAEPPYKIGSPDVMRVFRHVEERVRERFEWTLALDARYQCIVLALVADQAKSLNGYAKAYSAREILASVSDYWPEGFQDVAHNDLRGILEEMVGLGVLVRTQAGLYRLRSPNVVRLLGSVDDIEQRLLEFAGRPPVKPLNAERYRPVLKASSGEFSVLTQVQERHIVLPRFGVGLILGSRALGLDALPPSILRAFVGGGADPDGAAPTRKQLSVIPDDVVTDDELTAWLTRHVKEHVPTKGDVVVQLIDARDRLSEPLAAAIRFAQKPTVSKAKHWLRIVFVFAPSAVWRWALLSDSTREQLDRGLDFCFALDRWDASALTARLDHGDVIAPQRARDSLWQISGGWPRLVDEVMRRCWPRGELATAVAAVDRELNASSSALRNGFLQDVGIDVVPIVRSVVDLVRTEKSLPSGDAELAAFVEPPTSAEEYLAALDYLVRLRILSEANGLLSLDPVVARLLAVTK